MIGQPMRNCPAQLLLSGLHVCAGEFLGTWQAGKRHTSGTWRELRIVCQEKNGKFASVRSVAIYSGQWLNDRVHGMGRLMLRTFHPNVENDTSQTAILQSLVGLNTPGVEEIAIYHGNFNMGVQTGPCVLQRWRKMHGSTQQTTLPSGQSAQEELLTPFDVETSTTTSEGLVFGPESEVKWLEIGSTTNEAWRQVGYELHGEFRCNWEDIPTSDHSKFSKVHFLFGDCIGDPTKESKIRAIFGESGPTYYVASSAELIAVTETN